MVKEGVLNNPKVDVIFGLHINAQTEVEQYRPEGTWLRQTGSNKKSQVNKLMVLTLGWA
jgi:metal-dependent amidase/aminoacylase/carboxypeptidase family protein